MEQTTMGISPKEAQAGGIATVVEPLYRVKGWIKFAGILTIIGGAFQVLSIWGIVIAWLPIWMGILLVSSANLLEQAHAARNGTVMRQSFEKLGKYFKLLGVLMIVMVVLFVLAIVTAIMIAVFYSQAAMGV